jgi:hypothetical protein
LHSVLRLLVSIEPRVTLHEGIIGAGCEALEPN